MTFAARAAHHLARLPREPHLHVKRTLAVQARELLEADTDPAALAVMLERHAIELPERAFTLSPEQPAPARDPYVELGPSPPGPHAELNAALIRAEVAATTAAEVDDQTRLALARLADTELQRTVAIEAELDEPWGSVPVDVSDYARAMDRSAADRVEQLLGERGGRDEDPAV